MGLFWLTGGSYRLLPCLGIGPISRPCDLSPKLIGSRACKRSETQALLTKAKLVETLVYLHLPPMVGRLLANQVL